MRTEQEIRTRLAELKEENALCLRIASKNLSVGAFVAAIKKRINEKEIKILTWVLNEGTA